MVIEHEGYVASVEYDEDDEVLHGRVLNTRDVITFEGRSVKELKKAFADSIKDYRAMCAEDGVEPEKPVSGKFIVRIPPELHRQLIIAAARANKSLNAFVTKVLEERVQAHA